MITWSETANELMFLTSAMPETHRKLFSPWKENKTEKISNLLISLKHWKKDKYKIKSNFCNPGFSLRKRLLAKNHLIMIEASISSTMPFG